MSTTNFELEPPNPPEDEALDELITSTAQQIATGSESEQTLREKTKNDPRFTFLNDDDIFFKYFLFRVAGFEVDLKKGKGRKRASDKLCSPSTSRTSKDLSFGSCADVRNDSGSSSSVILPPTDDMKKTLIESLASAVMSEGKHLEEELRAQNPENPLYSFLIGGDGSDYYEFMLSVESLNKRRRISKLFRNPAPKQPAATSDLSSIDFSSVPQAPSDDELRQLIERVATEVVFEGKTEDEIKTAMGGNSCLSFLSGGQHHAYYQLCLSLKEVELATHRQQINDRDKSKYVVGDRRRKSQKAMDTVEQHQVNLNEGLQSTGNILPVTFMDPTDSLYDKASSIEGETCSMVAASSEDGQQGQDPPQDQVLLGTIVEEDYAPLHCALDDFAELNAEPTPAREIEEHNLIEDDAEVEVQREFVDNNITLHEDHDIDNEAILASQRSFIELSKKMDDFKCQIDQQPSCTPAELMHNMLYLSGLHNWTATEQSHVMMLLNSVFKKPIVPESRHLLDKYLVSSEGISYHFYCETCFESFENIDANVVKELYCPKCTKTFSISDLTKASFFITFDTRIELQNCLKSEKNMESLRTFFESKRYLGSPDGKLRDLYDGIMYQKFRRYVSQKTIDGLKDLSYTLCTDGTPLFKASNCSIWPLFFMINELSPYLRMHNLLLGGLWFGKCKPKMNLFLAPIVKHLKQLSKGFRIKVSHGEWSIRVHNIACCVDSGARGSVQGIHAHNGDCGCNWCLIPGTRVGTANYYPKPAVPLPRRSIEEILRDAVATRRAKKPVNGVLGITRLAAAPLFDIVNGMILDHLHNFNLGVARQFTKAWLGADGAKVRYYIGAPMNLSLMNLRIKMLRPPIELRKYQRTLDSINFWSGLEWENWVLYFSIPVLEGILPAQYLNHWACFVQSAHFLLNTEIEQEKINQAEAMLSTFGENVNPLYSKDDDIHHETFNNHILSEHAAQNVRNWGPQWAISSYAFESGNGDMKKNTHANRGIADQICRSISHTNVMRILEAECNQLYLQSFREKTSFSQHKMKEKRVGKLKFLGNSAAYFASEEEQWLLQQAGHKHEDFRAFQKVVCNGIVFGVDTWRDKERKSDNSYALTTKDEIVNIQGIILKDKSDVCFAIVKKVRVSPHKILRSLSRSHSVNKSRLLLCVDTIDLNKFLVTVGELSKKFVSIDVGNGHHLSEVVYSHNTV